MQFLKEKYNPTYLLLLYVSKGLLLLALIVVEQDEIARCLISEGNFSEHEVAHVGWVV